MRAKGASSPEDDFAFLSRLTEIRRGVVLLARVVGKPVAGITLINAGRTIAYEWGYKLPDPEYRHLPLHRALLWRGIELARQAGYKSFDLGGYWAELAEDHPINEFKLGFSNQQAHACAAMRFSWRPRITWILDRLN